MKILIIGKGVVGNSTGKALKFHDLHEINYWDVIIEKCDYGVISNKGLAGNIELSRVVGNGEFDYIFICVPTPTDETGVQNISSLMTTLTDIENFKGTVVLRSTVLPGTCDTIKSLFPDMKLVYFPEFLRERMADMDALYPDKYVIAGNSSLVMNTLQLFKMEVTDNKVFHFIDYKAAELAKYAANTFFSIKVTFANQMFDACKKLNVRWDDIKDTLYADKRIGKDHLWVTKERGFGGACLPKDSEAFLLAFPDFTLLKTAVEYNKKVRNKKG